MCMSSPRRIQRRRTRGWRMPDGAVYVGRPSKWGNPFMVGASRGDRLPPYTNATAAARYRQWLASTDSQPPHGVDRAVILRDLHELAGKDLACWCPLDEACHADVLLELANEAVA